MQRIAARTLSHSINPLRRSYATSIPHEVVILSAARTPIGKFQGSLSTVPATQLGITAVKAAISRANISPSQIQELFMGQVISGGAGQAPARQVVLGSGCPVETEATTINKVCASGMKAVIFASQTLQLGGREVMVAGGMENMSLVPLYLPRGHVYGNLLVQDGVLLDGLTDVYDGIHMGLCAENTAERDGFSREDQDAYAIESYRRAAEAWDAGKFKDEIVPVTVTTKKGDIEVSVDEEYKGLKLEKVPQLKPVFKKNGTVTAANASAINDGASAMVLTTLEKSKSLSAKPIARILSWSDAATKPIDFTIAPSLAIPIALKRAGLEIKDIAKWEINEAFAAVSLANTKILGLDPTKVNVWGGAVALGHPIGSSGSRIIVTLLHQLQQGEFGCAAICNGGGGSSAIVIQKL